MMLLILLTVLIVAVCAYDYVIKSSRVWRHLRQFPGEPALPLIGNALQLGTSAEDVQENLKRIWKKHGMKNFRLMFGTEPMLMICELDAIKKIMGSTAEIQKTDQHMRILGEFFGNSILNAVGDRWHHMRRMITPMFHFKLLEQYLEVANCESHVLLDKLRAHAGGPAFDVYNYILTNNLDVICRTTLGIHMKAQSGGEEEYVNASRKMPALAIKRFYSPWYRYDAIYKRSALYRESQENFKRITDSLDRIINYRREEFNKNILPLMEAEEDVVQFISRNRHTLTFIDIMLMSKMPDGSPISQDIIREETNPLVIAGFDTATSTMCFALSNLARYQDMQEMVYREQEEVFGADLTREPSLQELNNMKSLQRFIKESMRMFPTAAHFGRHLRNDIKLDDGKVIAAGTNVTVYVPGLHLNPDLFAEPDVFNPDRFIEPVPVYSFLPFSAGPKNCIGMNYAWMQMRATLSKILRKFKVSLEREDDFPQPINKFVMDSRNGFKLRFDERMKYL